MLTNRVGDYFLTIGFFTIFFTFGTLDYATVFSLAPYINTNVITFIAILLLLGAAAKSAQLGLHIWLPMAMEGPTPVSALIHASLLVARYNNYLELYNMHKRSRQKHK
jgi:NADH-ubiquinone oxidoreductase chain 5